MTGKKRTNLSALPDKRWTPQEYLAFERDSQDKHEYIAGEVYLMTGASESHNLIVANTITTLNVQLRKRPCRVYPSDMRVGVKVKDDYAYSYPDVSVVCETPQFEDDKRDTLLNPVVIIEVLSPSTEKYDRGKKFQNYRLLPSLHDYILIAQDEAHIEHYTRQANDEWLLSDKTGLEAIVTVESINCTLLLSDVYDKVLDGQ